MVAKNIESQEQELRELIEAAINKERQARARAFLYIIIPFVVGGLWLAFSMYKVSQIEARAARLDTELDEKNKQLEMAKEVLLAINPVLEKYGVMKELTVDDLNSNLVKQSFNANQQIQRILSESFQKWGVPVWYYSKDVNVDPTKVKASLEEFGFRVAPQNPYRPDLPTNLIAFGSQLKPDEAKLPKLVAYTLIRAGIEIRGMCQMSNQSKASIIEVLGDDRLINKPALTVEQIHNKQEFVQCPPNNVEWPQE